MAGKTHLVKEVMEFYTAKKEGSVRFIEEDIFKQLVGLAIKPEHKLFLWLCWDIGENSGAILQLRKRDFTKQINTATREQEYLINLRKEILKRTRTARTEPTNYKESVQFIGLILQNKQDNDLLFNFGQRQAEQILSRVVILTNAKVKPAGDKVKLKDLRSSMACHLLKSGWSCDEVNSRLGHKPSSKEIDKYVTYLALDKTTPKKKVYDSNLSKVQDELEEMKQREKLYQKRIDDLKENYKSEIHNLLAEAITKFKQASLPIPPERIPQLKKMGVIK
jgi:integrase